MRVADAVHRGNPKPSQADVFARGALEDNRKRAPALRAK
jgi:hypothetical protein